MRSEKRNPRAIRRGDVVKVSLPDGTESFEVVSGAELLLHLANGVDVHVPIEEDIAHAINLTPELKAKVEALQSAD